MATWTVKTKSGVRSGLTTYQLELLLRQRDIDEEAPAREEVPSGAAWIRVSEIPALGRQLRLQRTMPAPTAQAIDDATVGAMLDSLRDERYRRQLASLRLALQLAAGLFLIAEAAVFCRYLLGRE